jgi:FkbM family methyltransferase
MIHLLYVFLRKATTLRLTIMRCSNWPAITLAKLGVSRGPEMLRFRSGLRLRPMQPLTKTWGEIFEAAIADVYGITRHNPDLIVDVGANVGAFACMAAHIHPQAIVHAFEPSPPHADQLEQNAALNGLHNIIFHRLAITKDGRDVIFTVLGSGGSSGLFFHEGGTSMQIKSTSLDCIDFSRTRFLFLKLDCEGAEGEIVTWICANLHRLPSHIAIACEYHHWCPISRDKILQDLREHGFASQGRILFGEFYLFASLGTPA